MERQPKGRQAIHAIQAEEFGNAVGQIEGAVQLQMHRCGISPEREEDALAEAEQSGETPDQIDAKGNRRNWGVKSGGKALDIPMVVLVNEFSASASEVFTGAIIDNERATVIGATTFGKGSVNNLWPLNDGSGINFTTARWFTPNGELIEGEGITPDVLLDTIEEDEDDDIYLDRAIEILKEQISRGG